MFGHFGTVSSGTHKPADLMPAYADKLADLIKESGQDATAEQAGLLQEAGLFAENDYNGDPDDLDGVLDELREQLENYAPDYCYFGALEGDGADFGFWIDRHRLQEAVRDREIVQVNDLAELDKLLREGELISNIALLVNDHGNATLVEIETTTKEIWSVV